MPVAAIARSNVDAQTNGQQLSKFCWGFRNEVTQCLSSFTIAVYAQIRARDGRYGRSARVRDGSRDKFSGYAIPEGFVATSSFSIVPAVFHGDTVMRSGDSWICERSREIFQDARGKASIS